MTGGGSETVGVLFLPWQGSEEGGEGGQLSTRGYYIVPSPTPDPPGEGPFWS